jgi:adenylate kinase
MLYVFIGPPGSGKGTLARLFVQELGWEQISTGNLCRKHIQEQTEIGKEIDFAIKSGKLVSDSLITRMFYDWFMGHSWESDVAILDGFPRTVGQAQSLSDFVESASMPLKIKVIKFIIDDKKLVERLGRRVICENKECQTAYSLIPGSVLAPKKEGVCDRCSHAIGRRADDARHAIEERLKVYHQHEKELVGFFEKAGYDIYTFFTDKPVQDLFEELKNRVSEVYGHD